MPVYHIVLFKLKPSVTQTQIDDLVREAKAMVGKIPGLTKMDVGPPLPVTAHRSQGFNMGLVALLDTPEDVPNYGTHPAHQTVHRMREELCEEVNGTLAFDMVYEA